MPTIQLFSSRFAIFSKDTSQSDPHQSVVGITPWSFYIFKLLQNWNDLFFPFLNKMICNMSARLCYIIYLMNLIKTRFVVCEPMRTYVTRSTKHMCLWERIWDGNNATKDLTVTFTVQAWMKRHTFMREKNERKNKLYALQGLFWFPITFLLSYIFIV